MGIVNMSTQIASLLCLVLVSCAFGQENSNKLPVLFQFSQPSHNVAVFRGADLKKSIAAGIVPGFGNLRSGANSDEDREGRSDDDSDSAATAAAASAPSPAPVIKVVSTYTPAPVIVKPAPVVYRPAPVVYSPAPAPVVYR